MVAVETAVVVGSVVVDKDDPRVLLALAIVVVGRAKVGELVAMVCSMGV